MIQPTVLVTLAITIIGYIFCDRCHITTHKFRKSNGYHTFLNSAGYGILILFFSTIIFWLITCLAERGWLIFSVTGFTHSVLASTLPDVYIPTYSIHFIQIALIGLVISFTLPKILLHLAARLNKVSVQDVIEASFKKIASTDDSPEFSTIYYQSWDHGLPIAFTMKNRKVYIGYIVCGAQHMNDVLILPLKSGYRCNDELRLEIITDYQPVLEDLEQNGDGDELTKFFICLPIREIAHANLHDFGLADDFARNEKPKVKGRFRIPEYISQKRF